MEEERFFSIPWMPQLVYHQPEDNRVGIFIPEGVRLVLPCLTHYVLWLDKETAIKDRLLVVFPDHQLESSVDNWGQVISIIDNMQGAVVRFHEAGPVCDGAYMVVPDPELTACLETEIRKLCDCIGKPLPVRPRALYANVMVDLPIPQVAVQTQ